MESAQIWKGRKSAFGATGRVADYICMDGTVPTSKLPEALRRTGEICASYGLRVANVFHAGDGNMHPLILYNVNDEARAGKGRGRGRGRSEDVRRSRRLPDRRAWGRRREARSDGATSSPKPSSPSRKECAPCSIPTGGSTRPRCSRWAGERHERSDARARRRKRRRRAGRAARAKRRRLDIVGGGTRAGLGRPREGAARCRARALAGIVFHEPAEMTLRAKAGTPLSDVEAALAAHDQMLPFEPMTLARSMERRGEPTVGGLVATNAFGPAPDQRRRRARQPDRPAPRQWARRSNHSGGRVMKNVTGLDLVKLNCGAHGTLGLITEATFKLLPRPEAEATHRHSPARRRARDRGDDAARSARPSASPAQRRSRRHGTRILAHPAARSRASQNRSTIARSGCIALLAEFGAKHVLTGEDSRALWRAIRDAEFLAEPRERAVWRVNSRPRARADFVAGLGARALAHCYDWGGGLVWVATRAARRRAAVARRARAARRPRDADARAATRCAPRSTCSSRCRRRSTRSAAA